MWGVGPNRPASCANEHPCPPVRARPRIPNYGIGVPEPAIVACISGVSCFTSSTLQSWEVVSAMMAGVAPNIRRAAIAYPRDFAAGDPAATAGSTLVITIEIVLSPLRRMSTVRNCWGKSRSDAVSTSQKPRSGWASSDDGCACQGLVMYLSSPLRHARQGLSSPLSRGRIACERLVKS